MAQSGADRRTVLAVSGGGDSIALMNLYAGWARDTGAEPPAVLTVDHGLRESSRGECEQVCRWAAELGLAAHILAWGGAKPAANLEDAARNARYRLIGGWARDHGYTAVAVAHNLDDQAETFLMRLARGSGVDGLSAMRADAPYPMAGFPGLRLARPLLGCRRDALRAYLAALGRRWFDDPMNADPRFTRVRWRAALPLLAELGLTAERIGQATEHLTRARDALTEATAEAMRQSARLAPEGYALFDAERLRTCPREIGLRVLADLLGAISGAPYRPRFERLTGLMDALAANTTMRGRTLHGCRIAKAPAGWACFGPKTMLMSREYRAARSATAVWPTARDAGAVLWDGRFRLFLRDHSVTGEGLYVGALGPKVEFAAALAAIPPAARDALPAVYKMGGLLAVPHLEKGGTFGVEFTAGGSATLA